MIIDASALVTILTEEADANSLSLRLEAGHRRFTHAISLYETVTAVMRVSGQAKARVEATVERFLKAAQIETLPIGPAETSAALDAFERYGKGRHPAGLNMGDCFSYACARLRAMPLLYKSEDFARTDIPAA